MKTPSLTLFFLFLSIFLIAQSPTTIDKNTLETGLETPVFVSNRLPVRSSLPNKELHELQSVNDLLNDKTSEFNERLSKTQPKSTVEVLNLKEHIYEIDCLSNRLVSMANQYDVQQTEMNMTASLYGNSAQQNQMGTKEEVNFDIYTFYLFFLMTLGIIAAFYIRGKLREIYEDYKKPISRKKIRNRAKKRFAHV